MIKETRFEMLKRFYKGIKRYFLSSLGFPPMYRDRITKIYNFCRMVDNVVDLPEDNDKTLDMIEREYKLVLDGELITDPTILSFVEIQKEVGIPNEWVYSLFDSMRMDLHDRKYETLEDTLEYVYGAAEVVGLFMTKALDLPEDSLHSAQMLGRSAQWINFLRDIGEDFENGRTYFPTEDLRKFNLESLDPGYIKDHQDDFINFIKFERERFDGWATEGEAGYKFIPRKLVKPIRFATDLDRWKMEKIMKNPMIVYEKKLNPPTYLMVWKIIGYNTSFKKSNSD